jgi:hypothetical protein
MQYDQITRPNPRPDEVYGLDHNVSLPNARSANNQELVLIQYGFNQ